MKKFAFGLVAIFVLSSCNTMIGMGRDFRQLGTGLENKAQGRNFDGTETVPSDNLPTY